MSFERFSFSELIKIDVIRIRRRDARISGFTYLESKDGGGSENQISKRNKRARYDSSYSRTTKNAKLPT